jgi:iron complex outermembrane recepter protein
MKNFYLFIISILFALSSNSQELSGRVIDKNSTQGIKDIHVILLSYDIATKTDSAGYFYFKNNISSKKDLFIKISGIGYKTTISKISTNQNNLFELENDHIELEEMMVVSNQRGTLQKNSVTYIESKKLNDLNAIQNTTIGEALSNMLGVYQSSTAIGISKPVIRGLQGIRVVTLLNGLRIENQQWGGDHGMGVSELGIGSIEVIKGPASVLYGADAMGGVIYLIDEPYALQNQKILQFKSQFESNTLGTNNQLSYKTSGNNWRFSAAGLFTNHADYRLPNNTFAGNSRYNEQAGKINFGMNKKNWVMNVKYNFQRNRAGIPGHTHDSIINPLSFQIENQRRRATIPAQIINNHFLSVENKFFFKHTELSILSGHTYNRLTEFDEKVTIPGIDMALNNSILNVKLNTTFSEKFSMVYGVQGMYQQNNNLKNASETLLPKSNTLDAGMYAMLVYEIKKWSLQSGVRYDNRNIASFEVFKESKPIYKNYDNINYTFGAVRSTQKTTWRANVATGFRAPHITELLANGFHHGALRFEIGDINLVPEKSTQIDATFEFHHEHAELIINPFFSSFQNFIYIDPADTSIGGLPVFNYKQLDNALMYGADLGIHYHPHFAHNIHLESTFSYLIAEGSNGVNLPLIPQARINTLVKYIPHKNGKWNIEQIALQHSYHFDQTRVAIYETASAAYHLVNIGASVKKNTNTPITFNFGVRNLLNEKYINHLSRLKNIEMPHPGINFYAGIKIDLELLTN